MKNHTSFPEEPPFLPNDKPQGHRLRCASGGACSANLLCFTYFKARNHGILHSLNPLVAIVKTIHILNPLCTTKRLYKHLQEGRRYGDPVLTFGLFYPAAA